MADLYHYFKKWLFKALFAKLRLADIELTATRSGRQIEAIPFVIWCIKKVNPAIAQKFISGPIYTNT